MARPTKLTPKVQHIIVEALETGATYELAALAAGIDPSTFYRWKARGEEGDPEYQKFYEHIEQAEATALLDALKLIKAASANPKHWQAAAWLIERRMHNEYGRHLTTTPPLTDEQVEKLWEEVRARTWAQYDLRWKTASEGMGKEKATRILTALGSGDISALSDQEVRELLSVSLLMDLRDDKIESSV